MKRCWILISWLSLLAAEVVPERYIVELSEEPVAEHMAKQGRRASMRSPEARERRAQIRAAQREARLQMQQEEATVLESVDTVANALIVRAPEAKAARLARIPGVMRVHRVREVHLMLDHALPLHKVPEAWGQAGIERAGAGVKIALIDSGIDIEHPGFQDPSLPMPDGFPKVNDDSDLPFTNSKVIVARSYANLLGRTGDISARDHVGHGTATAMAAAGVLSTGPLATIVGVAPKAYLGSYKVFGSTGTTSEDVVLKAIDDAVADGMDVINLSLGNDAASRPEDDVEVKALERAAALGIIVVVAGGNNGPDPNTIGSPATGPSAIAVGASSNDRIFAASATVDGGSSYLAIPGADQRSLAAISAPVLDVSSLDPSGLACSPLPASSLAGRIAFILRGTCFFEEKLNVVQKAGAVAALIYTDQDRPDPITMSVGTATLPASMISYQNGAELKQRLSTSPSLKVTLRFSLGPFYVNPDRLADFSAQGPGADNAIKPDLVAVGTSFYTAAEKSDAKGDLFDASGYSVTQGTSFSAPLVAGAAALLKSARPGLSVAQYRSLLINTAAPLWLEQGNLARVQQAGAGLLDVSAALRATVAVAPAALNFGIGGPDPRLSRNLTLSQVGTASETYVLSAVPRDQGPVPDLSTNVVQLAPGGYFDVTVSFNGTAVAPGQYEGFLRIQGTNSGVDLRVPYWYGIASNSPRYITVLETATNAKAGAATTVILRVTDSSGIALGSVDALFSVVSGGGEVLGGLARSRVIPGAFTMRVRLGPRTGSNVFRIQIGDLRKEVTIVSR